MNTRAPESRTERKRRTRQDLLDAALRLLEDKGFSSLSLREVAREAGVVPTAFYRHFASMEELGLALIDDSIRTLRGMIRDARTDPATFEHAISNSVDVLVRHVHEHRPHFLFIARERYGGVAPIRQAIRTQIRLFASELATDLVRFPYIEKWSNEDVQVMASLLVNAMVSIVEDLLEAPADSPEAEAEIRRIAAKQLRMVVLSAPAWRSEPARERAG